ncbi:uncharacterized protein BJ171DRAFT_455631 [Polychytrium aggregatum]|uniref:uncharacterized protein n=1 Tax=Polychytrium aggregatum TaxID=110093 RepID=UPI0022FDCD98|nr:uncharacterized protein BJ171DRAFT_455631 [Polychytrium aggregatum]KAI9208349.1 hypothetical protein BJ171DRAFT_455631 [Polychytrium aggregatum]
MSSSPMIVQRLVSDEARKSLDSIVAKISGYPLVIQTFMTFYENYDTPLSELEATFAGALELQDGEDDTRSSLKVIVDLSLDSLMKRGDEGIEAARLFGALSLVAPANIQFELIKEIAQKMELKTEVTDLIKMVVQSGLLRSGNEGRYSTHLLTQLVAREYVQAHDELNVDGIEDATGKVLIKLTDSMDLKAQQFAEHLDRFINVTVAEGYTKLEHVRLATRQGELAEERGGFGAASDRFETHFKRAVQYFGTEEHIEIVGILNHLGDNHRRLGHLDPAEDSLNHALRILTSIEGHTSHPQAALTLHHMGLVSNDRGHYVAAKEYYDRALKQQLETHGTRIHLDIAETLEDTGNVLSAQGEYKEAERLYHEVFNIRLQIHGTREHKDIAAVLVCLGDVASSLGNYEVALKYYQEAFDIKTKVYGTREHPSVATTIRCLGNVADSQGNYEAALKYYQEALDISIKIYGTREHPSVATTIGYLGYVDESQGNYEAALKHYQEAFVILTKTFENPEHPSIKIAMDSISRIEETIREKTQLATSATASFSHKMSSGHGPNKMKCLLM